jgi:hypothetical protein
VSPKTDERALKWDPSDLRLSLGDLSQRYDSPVWDGFQTWARTNFVDDAEKTTVWNWLSSKPKVEFSSGKAYSDASERSLHSRRGTDEFAARTIGKSGEDVFRGFRSSDSSAAFPPEVSRVAGAHLAAVAQGRKALYHEQLADIAAPLADKLRRVLPSNIEVLAENGHLYAYRPEIIRQYIDSSYKGKSLFDKIRNASETSRDGELLGYGGRTMNFSTERKVLILDENGKTVLGFYAPKDRAASAGASRALDFQIYTERPHFVKVG